MKKIFYIGIPIIIIITVFLFFLFRKNPTNNQISTGEKTTPSVSLPPSTSNANKTTDPITKLERTDTGKLAEKTSSGTVEINNFAKGAEIGDNGVIYPTIKKNYNIGYNSTDDEFIITLLTTENIEATRKEAENDLLVDLGITKNDACKLKIFLYVSAALTEDKSLSENHGLSFCPGSKSFPN